MFLSCDVILTLLLFLYVDIMSLKASISDDPSHTTELTNAAREVRTRLGRVIETLGAEVEDGGGGEAASAGGVREGAGETR